MSNLQTAAQSSPLSDELDELMSGLNETPKRVSPKYFYDERGSQLFESICEQPEYYPTRTELKIMRTHIDEISSAVGTRVALIEYGSGASVKTRLLLEHLKDPAAYIPIDISGEFLASVARQLRSEFSELEILPVAADFTRKVRLPNPKIEPTRRVIYFPGSTIGNFSPDEARSLLGKMRAEAGDDGGLLIGADLVKSKAVLEAAYNDTAGVTAQFNLNLLEHLNALFDADFAPANFRHKAVYDDEHSRIEMRLISLKDQRITVADDEISIQAGEYLVTEHSHKFTLESFAKMAGSAGFEIQQTWTDPDELFSVQYFVAA